MGYIYLMLAIITEVIATSALKLTNGFTKLTPSVVSVIGYCLSFYFLAHVLKTVPTSIAYAIWCGIGIMLIALVDVIFFKQNLDIYAVLGVLMIVLGVVMIYGFSTVFGR